MKAARKVVQYLKGTIDYKLTLRGLDNAKDLKMRIWVDSSHGQCQDTRKGTTGIVITLGTSVIFHSSTGQSMVTLSSCESELVGIIEAAKEGIYQKRVLIDMGAIREEPVEIYTDSQSVMQLMKKTHLHGRTKHVDIRFYWLKQKLEEDEFILKYEPSETHISDALTKPLGRPILDRHINRMMDGKVLPNQTEEVCESKEDASSQGESERVFHAGEQCFVCQGKKMVAAQRARDQFRIDPARDPALDQFDRPAHFWANP